MADGPSAPLRVDRERFLVLVVALGACNRTQTSLPIVTVEPALPDASSAPMIVTASTSAPPPPVPVDVPPEDKCAQENDTGVVDCTHLPRTLRGPACEGVSGTCSSLAQGHMYRPRAASVAADCFARLGQRLCDIRARKSCYEEGVRASCPEPKWDAPCAAKMAECTARSIQPRYTKDECMRAMSALAESERDWALRAMGPSSEGKCSLMFTVY